MVKKAQELRVKTVTVSRLKAGPKQFENERIEVEVDVPVGRTASEAIQAARQFLKVQFGEAPSAADLAEAQRIIAEAARVPTLV